VRNFHLTEELMEGAYQLLHQGPPFNKWPKLPEAEEVEFHVLATPQVHGDCGVNESGRIYIRLSTALVGSMGNLIATMAHEMIHAYQFANPKAKTSRCDHDSFFKKAAKRCCDFWGFDPKSF
jgi:hypothetical protein